MPHKLNTNKALPNKHHNDINNFFSPKSLFWNSITTPKIQINMKPSLTLVIIYTKYERIEHQIIYVYIYILVTTCWIIAMSLYGPIEARKYPR